MTFRALPIILFLIATFSAGNLFADEIVLVNGNKVAGKITGWDGGKLVVETEHLGTVKIAPASITSIDSETQLIVQLADGSKLKGVIATETEGRFWLETASAGPTKHIEWDQLKAINPKPSVWKGNVNLGATLQDGNNDRVTASVGANASRKTDDDRTTLKFLWNYAEEDEIRTARNTYGSLKYDRYFYKELYGYLSIELLSDEFRDLNLRTTAGGGLGYDVYDDGTYHLDVETGIAYVSNDYEVADDEGNASLRFAANFGWQITESLSFSDSFVTYPSLEDSGEHQSRNVATLSNALGGGWALNLSNVIDYNSEAPAGTEERDMTWILSLQYSF